MYIQHCLVFLILPLSCTLGAELTLPTAVGDPAIDLNAATIHNLSEFIIKSEAVSGVSTSKTCPLGMTETQTGCECLDTFGTILMCNDSGGHAVQPKILRGYWIGYANISGNQTLVAGSCIFCSSSYSSNTGKYVYFNANSQCTANRTGTLCSECVNGTAPALNIHYYNYYNNTCVSCDNFNFLRYILVPMGLLSLLILFIYIFDFFPASGALNAMVFFAQIISSILQPHGAELIPAKSISSTLATYVDKIMDTIYGMWNLAFFSSLLPPFCSFEQMHHTISVFAINCAIALLPVLVISVTLLVHVLREYRGRLLKPCDKFSSCLKGCIPCKPGPWFVKLTGYNQKRSKQALFASAFFLSYTKLFLGTLYILTPTNLILPDGNVAETVVYFDGRLKYLSTEHLYYAVPFLCLGVFVLLSFPLSLLILRYDENSNNKKQYPKGKRAQFTSFCSNFLDHYLLKPFQRDFRWGRKKDKPCSRVKIWKLSWGLHDYRWMAGWYFLLRFALFATFLITMNFITQLVVQQLLYVLGVIVSISFRPYRYWLHNRVDAYIFLFLASINTLSLYQYHWTSTNQNISYWAFALQYTIAFIPAAMMIGYFFAKIVRNCNKEPVTSPGVVTNNETEMCNQCDNQGYYDGNIHRRNINTSYEHMLKGRQHFTSSVDTDHRVPLLLYDQEANAADFHPNGEGWLLRSQKKYKRLLFCMCSCGDPDNADNPEILKSV